MPRYSHSTVTTDKELGLGWVAAGSSFLFVGCESILRGILDELRLEEALLIGGGICGKG